MSLVVKLANLEDRINHLEHQNKLLTNYLQDLFKLLIILNEEKNL